MRKIFWLFLILTFPAKHLIAQSEIKALKQAEDFFNKFAYVSAIDTYEALLKNPKTLNKETIQKAKLDLAEAYYRVRDYFNSERVFSSVLKDFPILTGKQIESYKRYAQVLSSLGRYSDSKFFWEKFMELEENDLRGKEFSKLYSNLSALLRNQNSYNVEYLGINSAFPDFSPAYFGNGLVFVSGYGKGGGVKRLFGWDNSNFLDLYFFEDKSRLISEENSTAVLGVGGDNSGMMPPPKPSLGTDHYTGSTANDSRTLTERGSPNITGSQELFEIPRLESVKFSKKINTKYHEGPAVFYAGGKRVIFTRNAPKNTNFFAKIKGDGISRLRLYSAELIGRDWKNIKELPFNSDDFSNGHPAITDNGRVLYFVSDRPGGFGGTDLYYSVFENGKWSDPVNAGPKINTSGDELFPFLDANNRLYFSSDGYPGLGGLDIFTVQMDIINKQPADVVRNVGAPINSSFDDFGIITDSERREGFFSSNRKRGGNDDDIYRFTRVGALYGCRELMVKVQDSDTGEALANRRFLYSEENNAYPAENFITNQLGVSNLCLNADRRFRFEFILEGYESSVKYYSNIESSDYLPDTLLIKLKKNIPVPSSNEKRIKSADEKKPGRLMQKWSNEQTNSFRALISDAEDKPIQGVLVRFINLCNREIQEMTSRRDGTVEFLRDESCDYELVSSKDGFSVAYNFIPKTLKRTIFGTRKKVAESPDLFNSKLYKVGDVIRIPNIYYSLDGYKLSSDAKKELDKLIVTLKSYPNMAIEISSHTDARGNAALNLALSEKRADEVLKYLSGSIDKGRIRAIGKGETEPVNNCGDGVRCTEAEYAQNRRTEFKILRMEKR